MEESDDLPVSGSDRIIEREETYEHDEHGSVEVTGIWKGVEQIDEARRAKENEVIIVRYSTVRNEQRIDELTDTLDRFLEAVS